MIHHHQPTEAMSDVDPGQGLRTWWQVGTGLVAIAYLAVRWLFSVNYRMGQLEKEVKSLGEELRGEFKYLRDRLDRQTHEE